MNSESPLFGEGFFCMLKKGWGTGPAMPAVETRFIASIEQRCD